MRQEKDEAACGMRKTKQYVASERRTADSGKWKHYCGMQTSEQYGKLQAPTDECKRRNSMASCKRRMNADVRCHSGFVLVDMELNLCQKYNYSRKLLPSHLSFRIPPSTFVFRLPDCPGVIADLFLPRKCSGEQIC